MSVLIKGMGLPKFCRACQFAGFGGRNCELNVCMFTGESQLTLSPERMNNCPLIPAEDVRLVVHGEWGYRWKIHGDGRRPTELFPCSECGYENTSATNFCPNCGADMREES